MQQTRIDAERRLEAAKQDAPRVERQVDRLAQLPQDEFARRIARAFRRRHA